MVVNRWYSRSLVAVAGSLWGAALQAAPLAGIDVAGTTLRIRTAAPVTFSIEKNTANEVILFLPLTEPDGLPPSQDNALGTVSVQAVAGGTRLIYKPRALGSTFKVVAGQPVANNPTIEIQTEGLAQLPPPPPGTTAPVASAEEKVSLKVRDGDVRDTLTLLGRVAKGNVVTESTVNGRVSLNLDKVTFKDALTAIGAAAGLTINRTEGNVYIVSKPPASGLSNINTPGFGTPGADPSRRPVSFNVKNAELSSVVENIANQSGAALIIKGVLQDRVTGRISNVPFEDALAQLLNGTRFGFVKQGQTYLIGDSTPGTLTSRALEHTEAFPLAFTRSKDAKNLFPQSLTQFIKEDPARNAIVVSGTDAVRNQVRALIQEIDKPIRQVVFEVKIVELSETGSRELNVLKAFQTGSVVGFNPNTGGLVGGGTGTTVSSGTINTGGTGSTGTSIGTGSTITSNGGVVTVAPPTLDFANQNPIALSSQLTGGVAVGVFNNIARILEVVGGLINQGKARLLTDTKLNTISGQKGSIDVQTDVNLVLNQLTNVSGASVNNSTLNTLRAGTVVEITPTVQADGNVLAELSIESSSLGQRSSANAAPDISRRKVKNTLLVKDGQTIEIGGLIQNNTTENIVRLPLLGYLPLIGQLFSSTSTSVSQSELVVFLTPRVRDVQPAPGARLPLDPPR